MRDAIIGERVLRGMRQVERTQTPRNYGSHDNDWLEMALSLYFQLTMYTEGAALGIGRTDSKHFSFEANRQFSRQSIGRTLARWIKCA